MAQEKSSSGTHSPDSNGSSQEKDASSHHAGKTFFSKLGDLPQLKVGSRLLQGAALNWGIGIIASCGFLMFGYDQ
jgi:hypothetical protein